jgi:anti-sigma-K factor RskA
MSLSQDHIVLAAEYVLGTLELDEIEQAEQLIASDPEFAAMVREWERRLGELNVMVGAVEPPAETFDKIKERIGSTVQPAEIHLPDPAAARPLPRLGSAPQLDMSFTRAARPAPPLDSDAANADGEAPVSEQGGNVVMLTRRVRASRQTAGALAALAAAVCAVFVTSLVRPDLMPEPLRPKPQVVEVVRTVEKEVEKQVDRPNRFVAVMQRDSVSPAFILTVDLEARTMTVRRVAAETQADKSYELWLVSTRFGTPRSLGLVGDNEFTPARLASYEPNTISDAVYAISLEPTGGSPTGQPTGPVLWTGKLIEALPQNP